MFLNWAHITTSFEGGQFAGQPFPAFSESVITGQGVDHWTGILALIASLVAVAAAIGMVTLRDPATRRISAVAAAGGGAVATLMAIVAIFMRESIAVANLPDGRQSLDFARQFAEQLGGQAITISPAPSIGVFVTALGGAVAVVGGFMALRRTEPQLGRAVSEPPPPGTGFEAPTGPAGPQPTVPPEPPSASPPGEPKQAGETTPEPPPGQPKTPGESAP